MTDWIFTAVAEDAQLMAVEAIAPSGVTMMGTWGGDDQGYSYRISGSSSIFPGEYLDKDPQPPAAPVPGAPVLPGISTSTAALDLENRTPLKPVDAADARQLDLEGPTNEP